MESGVKGKHILAIDIGNTRAHFGIVDMDSLKCHGLCAIPLDCFREQLIATVLDLFERNDKSFCSQIVISSGVGVLAEFARAKLEDLFPGSVKVAKYSPELPFKCKYKKPSQLGSDRLASALYGYVAFSNKNLILISAGTAITIDLLYNNEYSGGTILPGISTQLVSLRNSTDALPLVSFTQMSECTVIPGLTTEECISAGVLYGAAGAIERIVNELKKICPDCLVLATGGDWNLLKQYVLFANESIPEMVLIGTALFFKFLSK